MNTFAFIENLNVQTYTDIILRNLQDMQNKVLTIIFISNGMNVYLYCISLNVFIKILNCINIRSLVGELSVFVL